LLLVVTHVSVADISVTDIIHKKIGLVKSYLDKSLFYKYYSAEFC